MSNLDFDEALERYHRAASEFVKGNPEPYKMVFSHRDDVSLGNLFGPFVCGWKQAAETMGRAASLYRDGEIVGFESLAKHVTPQLAYIVEVERIRAKIGGRHDASEVTLRSTSILRPEDDTWKVVHRHADPIASAQPPETIIRK
jgi:ketosteroid isomerase-like protein